MRTVKVLQVDDLGVSLVELNQGVYEIDGNIVSIGYRERTVQCKSTSIKSVYSDRVKTHAESIDGETMTMEHYEFKFSELKKPSTVDEEGSRFFDDIDDEYAFKKFTRDWRTVEKEVYRYSDPIPVEMTNIVIDTGCDFIAPIFTTTKDAGLYTYNRKAATLSIVNNAFSKLGMRFEFDIGYAKTEGKKIWGNSTHSHLRYVVAFGTYIFEDKWNVRNNPRGALKNLKASYESDKKELETIIKSRYAAHFGTVGRVDYEKMINLTKDALAKARIISAKQKSTGDKTALIKKLSTLQNAFMSELIPSEEGSK